MDTLVSEEEAAQFREYMKDPSARAAFAEFKVAAAQNGQALRYEHVIRAVGSFPWAIHEPVLAVIIDVLTFRAYGGRLTAEEIEGRIGAARRTTSTESPKGVARIPISGVIMPRAGGFEQMSGGTSAEAISKSLRSAVNSPDVTSIVLDIDSPGGSVAGIPELAQLVADANRIKPVVAVANHEAGSAAYWLASQAGRIVASPSARVGSIGVLSAHEETSEKDAKEGVKTTLVSAGKFKGESNPFTPLSDAARAHLQSQVDEFFGMFVEGVARGRGVTAEAVKNGFGEGRMVTAKSALSLGMIDGIGTIESVISEELNSPETRPTTTAAVAPPAVAAGQDALPGLEDGAAAPALTAVEDAPANQNPGDVKVNVTGSVGDPEAIAKAIHDEFDPDSDEAVALAAAAAVEPTLHVTSQMAEIDKLAKALHDEPVEEPDPRIAAAVDTSAWDGNKAMGQCSTAGEYRSICAGERTVGNPDERQHWALPHHYLGKGPNESGVRAALSRIGQTENLKNRAAAQGHLDAHMSTISPDNNSRTEVLDEEMEAIQAQLAILAGLPE